MHYGDGTEAKIGDIARGKGSNNPYPVQGVVVGLTAGATSCNLKLAITKTGAYPLVVGNVTETSPTQFAYPVPAALAKLEDGRLLIIGTELEYGTVADFELVYRPTAEPSGAFK